MAIRCAKCHSACRTCDHAERPTYLVMIDRQVVRTETGLSEALAYVRGRVDAVPEAERDAFKIELATVMIPHRTAAEKEAETARVLKAAAERRRFEAKEKRDRELIRLGREVERQRTARPARKAVARK